jgi:hypothetical protein
VKKLMKVKRELLLLDVFQAGVAKAPRNVGATAARALMPDADVESLADAAAGFPKFLTFNVSEDQARVQDIVTAIAHAGKNGRAVEIYARGDAALWAEFAAAVSATPVTLHLEEVPQL